MWSLGYIFVVLAVMIVYWWDGKEVRAFEADRINNRSQPSASSKKSDASFHNSMLVIQRWMDELVRKDGSRNFIYLIDIASTMLSIDRDARSYSWEVEICLHEQFHPEELGDERRAKMRDRVQAPKKSYIHNPLVRAIAEGNLDLVQCLCQKGSTLGPSSSSSRSIVDSENTSGAAVSLLENCMPPLSQIGEVFKRAYEAQGYGLDDIATKGRRDALAQKFAETVASAGITFWVFKHILEPRNTLESMKIFAEKVRFNQRDDHQNTTLFWSSWGREVIVVDILLRYGAELHPINKLSETPPMVASRLGHAAVVGRYEIGEVREVGNVVGAGEEVGCVS